MITSVPSTVTPSPETDVFVSSSVTVAVTLLRSILSPFTSATIDAESEDCEVTLALFEHPDITSAIATTRAHPKLIFDFILLFSIFTS